jgi:tetratricopeptide (TPR) repeat protein
MGKPKDEELYCRKAIASNPDFLWAQLYLADSLHAQGRLDEAVKQYRYELGIDPDNYLARNELGAILDQQGLATEALAEFRRSLRIEPNQPVAHAQIDRILAESHQLPGQHGITQR